MRLFFFLLLFLGSVPTVFSQLVITEFLASNDANLQDEDGDYSDWLEIHNPTASAINLAGWTLSDDADDLAEWTFPAREIAPGEYLVIFASNKNRTDPAGELHTNFALSAGGEYLGLANPQGAIVSEFAPEFPSQREDVSYGRTFPSEQQVLVDFDSPARALVPENGSLGASWRDFSFDDSAWTAGNLGVGYDRDSSGTNLNPFIATNVENEMYERNSTVYVRVPFTVGDPDDVIDLELTARYEDGFAAFLNGNSDRIAEANAPGALAWDSQATDTIFDGLPEVTINLNDSIASLTSGENLLALHGLNVNTGSSDMLVSARLEATVARPDLTSQIGFFAEPTPGERNGGNDSLALTDTVTYSVPQGTFSGTLSLELSGAGPDELIRYTFDGSVPTADSMAYTGPLNLSQTRTIRAKVFDASGASGPVNTGQYTRLGAGMENRRSNLPMVILDARGQELSDQFRSDASFLLFDGDENGVSDLSRTPAIATRQGLRFRGSSSLGFDKKPYSMEFWDETDDDREIAILGMPADSDWVFYNPYRFDTTYIRNAFIYELSRRAGRYAPRTRFVEVFYNDGDDLTESDLTGIYCIIEQVRLEEHRIGFERIDTADVPPDGPIDVNAEGDWTGGYLLKVDRVDPDEYAWETDNGIPPQLNGTSNQLVLNRPKLADLDGGPYSDFDRGTAENNSRQIQYLRAFVGAFDDALFNDWGANFGDPTYQEFIDRDSFVDHLLFNAFANNVDGLRLSAFMYKARNQPLVAGPLWDFDRSFDSRDGRDDNPFTWSGGGDATDFFNYSWWGLLSDDPDFAQAVYDRWAELRKDVFSDANLTELLNGLRDEVNDSSNGVGSAAVRDADRWQENEPLGGSYNAEAQMMLDWVLSRANWMDRRRINEGLLPEVPSLNIAGNSATLSGGAIIYFTTDGSDPRAPGGDPAGELYSEAISLAGVSEIRARVFNNGAWSTPAVEVFDQPVVEAVFQPAGSGIWNLDANWSSTAFPDGINALARINGATGGNREVTLQAPVTIGSLNFPQANSSDRNRIQGATATDTLTFASSGEPSLVTVGGTGTGFVEFEIEGGTILQNELVLDVDNIFGDEEHGALRLREMWTGNGGLIKRGPGQASLTGGDKNYSGSTLIEQGVLAVTAPAAMGNSSVTVQDGGQLRLTSSNDENGARDYTFGGDLLLNGQGRGEAVPADFNLGRLGALRYDPAGENNTARLNNAVSVESATDIHVAGNGNRLELLGGISGSGNVSKTGGGIMALSGDNSGFAAPIAIANGTFELRGEVASALTAESEGILDLAGTSGALAGDGDLALPATRVTTPSVDGLNRSFLMTTSGALNPEAAAGDNNALIITDNPGTPLAQDFYLDIEGGLASSTRLRGGYWLPSGIVTGDLLDAPTRVFVPDANGSEEAFGQSWSEETAFSLTAVPVSETSGTLEIRFDGQPLTFADWQAANFSGGDLTNPAVSGPEAQPFGDGVANLLRYALGVAPGENALAALPNLRADDGSLDYGFSYDPGRRGIRWIVESSPVLDDWENAEILFDSASEVLIPTEEDRLEILLDTEATRQFVRLRIEQTE